MELRVKASKFTIGPSTSEYLESKLATLEKLLGKGAATAQCNVELGKASGKHKSDHMWFAEVHVVSDGAEAYARNHAQSVNAAIDDVKEEVERQLRKASKTKRRAVRKGGAAAKRQIRNAA